MTRDDTSADGDAGSDDDDDNDNDDDQPLLSLPESLRHELKDPMGPVETDAGILLEGVDGPLIAVGDVVTYHLLEAGRTPDVALIDGYTKREAVDAEVERVVSDERGEDDRTTLEVTNPPAVLTRPLLEALVEGLERPDPVTIVVDGEEDLAVLPALLAAPEGASVVYGQPDVGMVHVTVDAETRESARDLLERFDGDVERALALLEA
ncbi:GTP-dependent dephospho-CoA kinase family protein [Natronosalvus halobius]|uniref:GTP-dependent dephospho-CoA kinase family protein n=1 Tax=Natronosalvus halobius TaxID=2953746 RepID=UPI00209C9532|nr:GTP-dependent dephospho-CoA kinase family protein [Natronosalvus halobius]USZ70409.1 GTP-dependent dephospho-CoA kinase family protein [Natronosalvus halobius]